MEKPNCYKCKHRGTIPGDCHSKCNHPKISDGTDDLNVTGNEQSIRGGWFSWPMNFDPIWLETCDGFESRGEEDDR